MTAARWQALALVLLALGAAVWAAWGQAQRPEAQFPQRQEVVFWHFWGGEDRAVVDGIVDRFNQSQEKYFVRAVAMPGNNLDLKFFLAVTGGDPPDLLNQDDPIVADWAHRGALVPLDELAAPAEVAELDRWLLPAAKELGSYQGRLFALCNGLDVRALYYNRTLLEQHNLAPPATLAELDAIAEALSPAALPPGSGPRTMYAYLPDPRRLWAWGIVFGGEFYDPQTGRVTADSPPIVAALQWMTSYRRRYGAEQLARFRHGDQSLPGKSFPLLAVRYALVMDGQWRIRDIAAAQNAQRALGLPVTEYGVCPLPPPPGGRVNAGWVNGNFFVVPRGARCRQGAWEFMKFWSGFGGHEAQAARACVAGGWIPPSAAVAAEPEFRAFLDREPLFARFVELSQSPHQIPTPVIPGAAFFFQEVVAAAERSLLTDHAPPPAELLRAATQRVQERLDAIQQDE